MVNEETRIYKINDSIIFRKTTEKFGGLSNMASGYLLFIKDIPIKSSEALYQAMRFPHMPNVQLEIINQNSPMTAKMVSKKYLAYTREDWDDIRVGIMKWVLRIKLVQNKDTFGKLLLDTELKDIVEESRKDEFWGAKKNNDVLVGMNVLGRLLMELRKYYKEYTIEDISPLNIQNFKLYGREIDKVSNNDKINFSTKEGLFK